MRSSITSIILKKPFVIPETMSSVSDIPIVIKETVRISRIRKHESNGIISIIRWFQCIKSFNYEKNDNSKHLHDI